MKTAYMQAKINSIQKRIIIIILIIYFLNIFLHTILDGEGRASKLNAIFKAFISDKERMETFQNIKYYFHYK